MVSLSAIKVGFEYLLCFTPGLFTALAGTLNAKSYKVLFWREITPLCCSYLHGECLCPVDGVPGTFLVSWLGKDAMAGVGLADSFNMVIMAFAAIDLGTTVVVAFSLGKARDRRRARGGDAAVISDHDVVCRTVGNAYSSFWRTNCYLISSRVMPRQKLKHWR